MNLIMNTNNEVLLLSMDELNTNFNLIVFIVHCIKSRNIMLGSLRTRKGMPEIASKATI